MRIINIPIEPLEERYSAQWHKWFKKEFDKCGVTYITINPTPLTDKIHRGAFLDIAGTNYYKSSQIAMISEMFFKDEFKDGDIFFFHDIWHPGLEALAYMRDGLGIDIKITGCIFAGTYDPYDFTTKTGMGYWGKLLEESWFRIVDKIFSATEFHKRLILQNRDIDPKKIVVTGHPMYNEFPEEMLKKENIVVFPHRLDSEKNPQMFDILKEEFGTLHSSWQFIKTKEVCKNKKEYYNLLQKAKVSISFADQETLGFAMIESIYAGCIPFVPDRLSYSELYDLAFKYSSFRECYEKLDTIINRNIDEEITKALLINNKKEVQEKCESAIPKMIEEMIKL